MVLRRLLNPSNCRGYELSFDNIKVACIVPAEGNESLRYSTHCAEVTPFGSSQTKIYCIDEAKTNINNCKVSSKDYNYDLCMKLLYFTGKDKQLNIDVHNEALVRAQHDCRLKNGLELTLDGKKFACIEPISNEADVSDSVCVSIDGYDTPYCIKSNNTNIKSCDKDSNEYNLNYCLRFLSSAGRINKLSVDLYAPSKNGKRTFGPDNYCRNKNGIYLSFNNGKYVCITPQAQHANESNDGKTHCVTVKKHNYNYNEEPAKAQVYCVDESLTNDNNCNVHSDIYDYNSCMQYVTSVGRSNDYSIDVYSDKQECEDNKGVYLSFDDKKYVCLVANPKEDRREKHCLTLKKYTYGNEQSKNELYCIREQNTNNSNCNIHSKNYDYNSCMQYVVSVGRSNNYKIDVAN